MPLAPLGNAQAGFGEFWAGLFPPFDRQTDVPLEIPVKALDIDRFLINAPWNRVLRIGVELEGAWSEIPKGSKIVRDGSVMEALVDNGGLARARLPNHKVGEIPIGPLPPTKLASAMRKCYPSMVDASCGMHIHMSFESLYQYVLLADSPAYQDTLVTYLERWAKEEALIKEHPIWARLANKNEYCQRRFWPDEQIACPRKDHDRQRQGHRYTMVHYNWVRNGTVECRLLPMMSGVEQAIRAIKQVIAITNGYLVAADKTRPKISGRVEISPGMHERQENTEKGSVRILMDNGAVYEERLKVII